MSDMAFSRELAQAGDRRPVRASDFDTETVKDGNEVTVYATQVLEDQLQFWGHGGRDRRAADTSFYYADVNASGNGSGAAGDPITGELIAAITDSEQRRVLASVTLGDLEDLADAATDDRTDRPIMYAVAPYAKPGRYLELRILSDSASDGYEVDSANSDAKLWRSVISN